MFFRRVLAVASSTLCLVGSVNAIAASEGSANGFSSGVDIETNVGGFFVAPFSSNAFGLSLKGRNDVQSAVTIGSTKVKSGGGLGLFAEFLPESLSPVFFGASVSYEKVDHSGTGAKSNSLTDSVLRGELVAGVSMSATESLDIYADGRFGLASHTISGSFTSDGNDPTTYTAPGTGSFSGLANTGYSTGLGAGIKFKFGEASAISLGYQYSMTSAVPATKAGADGMTSTYSYGATPTQVAGEASTTTDIKPGLHLFKLAISTRVSAL